MLYTRLLIFVLACFLLTAPARACGEMSAKTMERYVKMELPIPKCSTKKQVKPAPKSTTHKVSPLQKILPALEATAHDVVCLGWADLNAKASSIELHTRHVNCERLSHASMPAVFVKWQDDSRIEYIDALIEGNNGFSSVWHAALNGRNFKTINNISLSKEAHQQWLSITIHQTTMPDISNSEKKSGPPKFFQSGAPLERRFVYSEKDYQLDRKN